MKKIVYLGTQPEYWRGKDNHPAKVFCRIETEQKDKGLCLSISGAIGPLSNGDAIGSCGQCQDNIKITRYAEGWDRASVTKFLDIWNRWHLNDMNAATAEMRQAGWLEMASREIFKYSFSFTSAAYKERRELEDLAIEAAKSGVAAKLDDRQRRLLAAKSYCDLYGYTQPDTPEFMELSKDILRDNRPKIERKTLGWVSVKEHPDGLLGRELNGFKYGNAWYFEEVPAEVIAWLEALPPSAEPYPWRA